MQFDLSPYADSGILRAMLHLYIINVYQPVDLQVNVYRLTGSWTESGVTWITRDGVTPWLASGGDYDATVRGTANLGSTIGTWHEIDITGLVRDWIDDVYPNYGLLLASPGYTAGNWTACAAKEYGEPTLRPYLEIVPGIFADGFESGDTSAWSIAVH